MKIGVPLNVSRRRLTINIVVTLFGGAVLVIFLTLLGLLYWMTAPVKLPSEYALAGSAVSSSVILRSQSQDELPAPLVTRLTSDLPTQVERLIASASESSIQIVTATVQTSSAQPEPFIAISLTRSPGRFWLVRRDIVNRIERQSLPFSIQYSDDEVIFAGLEDRTPAGAFSLSGCSLIRAARPELVEQALGRLQPAREAVAPGPYEGLPQSSDIRGWSEDWRNSMALGLLLPEALLSQWNRLPKALNPDSSEAGAHAVQFWGEWLDGGTARIHVRYTPSGDAAAAAAEEADAWLQERGGEFGLQLPGASVVGEDVQLDFTISLEGK